MRQASVAGLGSRPPTVPRPRFSTPHPPGWLRWHPRRWSHLRAGSSSLGGPRQRPALKPGSSAGSGGMEAGIEGNAYADGSVVGHGTSPPVGHQPGSGPKVPFRAGRRSAALWPKYPTPDGRSKRSCPGRPANCRRRPTIATDEQYQAANQPRPWPASPRQGRCDRCCSRFALSGAGAVAAFGPRRQVLRV